MSAVVRTAPSLLVTILLVHGNVIYTIAPTILITTALIATTGSIFPFGLSRQAESPAGQLVQFLDESLAVIPTERKSKPLIISSLDFFYTLNWRVFGVLFIVLAFLDS